jgi:hypothetical protein
LQFLTEIQLSNVISFHFANWLLVIDFESNSLMQTRSTKNKDSTGAAAQAPTREAGKRAKKTTANIRVHDKNSKKKFLYGTLGTLELKSLRVDCR